ncbi:hypothetical protein Msub_13140 [Marinobacter subterrani]|uniref:Uncharacterized protein n=1 Tax=Marinobacter subterrani TaxID=1658765 RepID=A0A0J7M7M8_9GAMM|nr:hypothetical protein Msub_13140 [Marinobacter subterrani]
MITLVSILPRLWQRLSATFEKSDAYRQGNTAGLGGRYVASCYNSLEFCYFGAKRNVKTSVSYRFRSAEAEVREMAVMSCCSFFSRCSRLTPSSKLILCRAC